MPFQPMSALSCRSGRVAAPVIDIDSLVEVILRIGRRSLGQWDASSSWTSARSCECAHRWREPPSRLIRVIRPPLTPGP